MAAITDQRVIYYRSRRPGPEIILQDMLLDSIPRMLSSYDCPYTVAASLPIGAGQPDLTIATYGPELKKLGELNRTSPAILGYLRTVGRARIETIESRLGLRTDLLRDSLQDLTTTGIVQSNGPVFSLAEPWRDILPEVIAIEVKVSDWRCAVEQAGRNKLFSHQSMVALPSSVAQRVHMDSRIRDLGLGVLGIDNDGTVKVYRRPQRKLPRLWTYYFELAMRLVTGPGRD